MGTETAERNKIHQGKNMKHWRQIMGVTQIEIADFLQITQQAISKLEDKEEVDPQVLEKVAEFIKVPADVIRNKEPQEQYRNVTNTLTVSDTGQGTNLGNGRDGVREIHYYNCTFNITDKSSELYERLLDAEREKTIR